MFCVLASPRRLERQNLCQIQARMLTSPPQETCTHTLTSEQPGRVSHGWAWNPGAEKLSPSSPPQHLGDWGWECTCPGHLERYAPGPPLRACPADGILEPPEPSARD